MVPGAAGDNYRFKATREGFLKPEEVYVTLTSSEMRLQARKIPGDIVIPRSSAKDCITVRKYPDKSVRLKVSAPTLKSKHAIDVSAGEARTVFAWLSPRGISFPCRKCGQHLVIDAPEAGTAVLCPKCGCSLTVPFGENYSPSPDKANAPVSPVSGSFILGQSSTTPTVTVGSAFRSLFSSSQFTQPSQYWYRAAATTQSLGVLNWAMLFVRLRPAATWGIVLHSVFVGMWIIGSIQFLMVFMEVEDARHKGSKEFAEFAEVACSLMLVASLVFVVLHCVAIARLVEAKRIV